MVKYLETVIGKLKAVKSGMTNNAALWTGQPETVANVQARIDELETKGRELDELENALKAKRAEARALRDASLKYIDKVDNLASGLHSETPEKLAEYEISLRKPGRAVPKPTKVLIPILEDDTDGVGFIVSTQYDSDAFYYEWLKGTGADAKDPNTTPQLHLFKTTTKTSFVDDEVEKGVRYFYKVQAVNTKGMGPMSEAVSRVQ